MCLIGLVCSKFDNYSKFNCECNWEDLHAQLGRKRIFTVTKHKIFIRALEIMRNKATASISISNHLKLIRVLDSLRELAANLRVSV